MEIITIDINNRRELNKKGYDSKIYYCGNYSMQKYYSYIYRFLQRLGVKFALNRACFIHDINYGKLSIEYNNPYEFSFKKLSTYKNIWKHFKYWFNKTFYYLKIKLKIDNQFFLDMQDCIMYEYKKNNISLKHSAYLRLIACIFYSIVILATPFYLKQK